MRPLATGSTTISVKFDYAVFPTASTSPTCTAAAGFTSLSCSVDTTTFAGSYWQVIATGATVVATPTLYSFIISTVQNSFSTQTTPTGTGFTLGECVASGGSATETITLTSLSGPFGSVTVSGSVTASTLTSGSTVSQNGVTSVLTIVIIINDPFSTNGWVVITLPKQEQYYVGNGLTTAPTSMLLNCINAISCTPALSTTATLTFGSTTSNVPILSTSGSYGGTTSDQITIQTNYGAFMQTGSILTLEISSILNPPSYQPFNTIQVQTTDANSNEINTQSDVTLTTSTPGTFTGASMSILSSSVVGASPSEYSFYMVTANPIPDGGYLTIALPTGASATQSLLSISCIQGCVDSNGATLTYDSATNTITATNIFTYNSATSKYYVNLNQVIEFAIDGFTNPSSQTDHYYLITSYDTTNGGSYIIDTISTLYITPSQGDVTVTWAAPQNTSIIYDIPTNYTFQISSSIQIEPANALLLTFPSDFEIQQNYSCEASGFVTASFDSTYTCVASSTDNTIIIGGFTTASIAADTLFTFTVNSIQNPGTYLDTNPIVISQIPSASSTAVMAEGSYSIPAYTYNASTIEQFTVTPSNYNAGQYPTDYTFTIVPRSRVNKGSYIHIEIPPEVIIPDLRDSMFDCGGTLNGFTTNYIFCGLTNDGKDLRIDNGFWYNDTDDPPTLQFTMSYFKNPRSTQTSSNFNATIYTSTNELLYSWNISYAPNVTMTNTLGPASIYYNRSSMINGDLTTYTWTLTLNNSYQSGDTIAIQAPSPIFFTQYSRCFGVRNLFRRLNCSLSSDLQTINITVNTVVKLAQRGNSRNLATDRILSEGSQIKFNITNVKNAYSLRPTLYSFIYTARAEGGYNIESVSDNLYSTNLLPYEFPIQATGVSPQVVTFGQLNNYTLSFVPKNYEIGMTVIIVVPPELEISKPLSCYGIEGTDTERLNCSTNYTTRTINITDGFNNQQFPPENVTIVLSMLRNPRIRQETSSFQLQTYTFDNFLMDQLITNLSVSFICNMPCKTCSENDYNYCYSCYPATVFQYYFDADCQASCPDGYYADNKNLSCESCLRPCSKCTGSESICLECVRGYILQGSECIIGLEAIFGQDKFIYPWPFLACGFLLTIIVLIIVLCSKETKFRESDLALVAWPEYLSWIALAGLQIYYNGYTLYFLLVLIAISTQSTLNIIYVILHQKAMVPNAAEDYKHLIAAYRKCHATILIFSIVLSFKFHHLILSYLNDGKHLKGNFNMYSWKVWNAISLTYIFISYLPIAGSTVYFILTSEFGSILYYVNIEVLILSTYIMILLLVSQFQYCCCPSDIMKKNRKVLHREDKFNQLLNDQSSSMIQDVTSRMHIDNDVSADIETNQKTMRKDLVAKNAIQQTNQGGDEEVVEIDLPQKQIIKKRISISSEDNLILTEREKLLKKETKHDVTRNELIEMARKLKLEKEKVELRIKELDQNQQLEDTSRVVQFDKSSMFSSTPDLAQPQILHSITSIQPDLDKEVQTDKRMHEVNFKVNADFESNEEMLQRLNEKTDEDDPNKKLIQTKLRMHEVDHKVNVGFEDHQKMLDRLIDEAKDNDLNQKIIQTNKRMHEVDLDVNVGFETNQQMLDRLEAITEDNKDNEDNEDNNNVNQIVQTKKFMHEVDLDVNVGFENNEEMFQRLKGCTQIVQTTKLMHEVDHDVNVGFESNEQMLQRLNEESESEVENDLNQAIQTMVRRNEIFNLDVNIGFENHQEMLKRLLEEKAIKFQNLDSHFELAPQIDHQYEEMYFNKVQPEIFKQEKEIKQILVNFTKIKPEFVIQGDKNEMIKKAQEKVLQHGKKSPFETIQTNLMEHDANNDGIISKDDYANFIRSQTEKNQLVADSDNQIQTNSNLQDIPSIEAQISLIEPVTISEFAGLIDLTYNKQPIQEKEIGIMIQCQPLFEKIDELKEKDQIGEVGFSCCLPLYENIEVNYEKEIENNEVFESLGTINQPLLMKSDSVINPREKSYDELYVQGPDSKYSKGIADEMKKSQQEIFVDKQQSEFGTIQQDQELNEEFKEEIPKVEKKEVKAHDFYQPVDETEGDEFVKRKKKVLYSDKSESSVDEKMEDTPSNYNIPNGRLDGKSLGLKAMLLYNQKSIVNKKMDTKTLPLAEIQENTSNKHKRFASNPPRYQHQEEKKFVNNLFREQQDQIGNNIKNGRAQQNLMPFTQQLRVGSPTNSANEASWRAFNNGYGSIAQIVEGNETSNSIINGQIYNSKERLEDKSKKKKKKLAMQKQFKEPPMNIEKVKNLEGTYLGHMYQNNEESGLKTMSTKQAILPKILEGQGSKEDKSKEEKKEQKEQFMKNNYL